MNNGPYGPAPGALPPGGGYPPPGGYPPSGYGGPPPGGPPAGDDTLSWVAIGCGAGSWLTCCCAPIPFVGTIAWLGGLLLAIAGTIAGYMAWQSGKRAGTRTDLAMTGMVLGATRLGLTILFIGAILVLVALGMGAGIIEGLVHGGG